MLYTFTLPLIKTTNSIFYLLITTKDNKYARLKKLNLKLKKRKNYSPAKRKSQVPVNELWSELHETLRRT